MGTSTGQAGRAEQKGWAMDFYGLLEQIRLDRLAALDALADEHEGNFRRAVQRLADHAALLADDVRGM